jgi:hypothetical protein
MKNFKLILIFIPLLFVTLLNAGWGQISITSLPYSPAVTTFDSFNPTDASAFTSTIPTGWSGSSSGTAAYKGRGTGSSNAGGYWAYGSGSEYSLGALRSGTPGNITYTVSYTNNSGGTITSITFSWDYEQWRYANTSGWDCSGTGQLSGNSTLNAKDFTGSASGTSGSVTVTPVTSFTLSGLSIANGQTFGISWVTTDASSSDNGIAIDNFSISASGSPPSMTVNPTSLSGFSYSQGSGPSVAKTSVLNGSNLNPSSGNITITGSTNYEVSTNGSTFSSSQTIAYTSSTLNNSTIYVRLKAGLTSGTYNNENVVVSGGGITSQNIACSGKILSAEPVIQATNITSDSVSTASMVISWTNGSGTNRAVFMKEGVQGTITDPTDSVSYSASANWNSKGTQLGSSGYYCIFNGSDNSVSLTNLTTNTNYWIQVFEYNGSGIYTNYLTITASGNPNNFYVTPTIQASNIIFPTVASNSITASWTNGNGSGRIVIINTSNSFVNPSNGTNPSASTNYSGSGQQVVFNGTGNTVAVTNLSAGVTYWFRVYDYNGSSTSTQYNVNTATSNPNNQSSSTATYIWTGGVGDLNWNTAGNWSPSRNSVSSSDKLTFDNTGILTLSVNQSETVDWLTISGNTNLTLNSSTSKTITVGTNISIAGNSVLSTGSNVNISLNSVATLNINGFLNCGTSTISGDGNLNLSSTGTLGIGSSNSIAGNLTTTGTKTFDPAASFTFNGNGFVQSTVGLPTSIGNLTINNSNGVLLQNNLNIEGTLTLSSGTFIIGYNTLTLNNPIAGTTSNLNGSGNSSIIISGNASGINIPASISNLNNITLNNPNGTVLQGDLNVVGTIYLSSGAFSLNSHTLTLSGSISTTSGTITGSSGSNIILSVLANSTGSLNFSTGTDIHNFSVNSTGSTITLNSNLTIYGNMNVTNGTVDILDNVISLASTGLLVESTNNVIKSSTGNGIITITKTLTNPVADNCNGIGVTISSESDLGNTTIERHLNYVIGNGNSGIKRWFNISPTNNSGLDATVVFKYDPTELNSNTENNLSIFKSINNGLSWIEVMNKTLNNINKTLTTTGVDDFSRWTFANSGALPVEMLSFNSSVSEKNVTLKWITSSEINNSGFEILRSDANENNYLKIGFVKGNGTTSSQMKYTFSDYNTAPGKYKYKLKQIDNNGNFNYFNLNNIIEILPPKNFYLSQNYPNPFNPVTKIDFELPVDSKVNLIVFDILGREVKSLVSGELKQAGYYTVEFNASSIASGLYFYRMEANSHGKNLIFTNKMIVLK